MSSHRLGWCSCPDCPQNPGNRQVYGPNYVWMPRYQQGHNHWHHVCDWCDVWSAYEPDFESNPLYVRNSHIMEPIHSFFKGYPLAPHTVAQYIYAVADASGALGSGGRRRLGHLHRHRYSVYDALADDLYALAEAVADGRFINLHSQSRRLGSGRPWRQPKALEWTAWPGF